MDVNHELRHGRLVAVLFSALFSFAAASAGAAIIGVVVDENGAPVATVAPASYSQGGVYRGPSPLPPPVKS